MRSIAVTSAPPGGRCGAGTTSRLCKAISSPPSAFRLPEHAPTRAQLGGTGRQKAALGSARSGSRSSQRRVPTIRPNAASSSNSRPALEQPLGCAPVAPVVCDRAPSPRHEHGLEVRALAGRVVGERVEAGALERACQLGQLPTREASSALALALPAARFVAEPLKN